MRLEDISEFVAWLLPPAGRAGQVALLTTIEPQMGAATIKRKPSLQRWKVLPRYALHDRAGVGMPCLRVMRGRKNVRRSSPSTAGIRCAQASVPSAWDPPSCKYLDALLLGKQMGREGNR